MPHSNQQQWGQQSYQQQGHNYPPQQQQQWGYQSAQGGIGQQSYQQGGMGQQPHQQGGMGHKWGPQPPIQGWGGNNSNPNSQWGDLSQNNGWGNFVSSNPTAFSNSGQPQINPMQMLGNVFNNANMPPANNNPYGGNGNNGYGGNSYGNNPYQ